MEDTVTLTMSDAVVLQVLTELDAGGRTAADAATALGLSVRQVRRKLAAYRSLGVASIPHQSRGRITHNALSQAQRSRVEHLAKTVYAACNDHHFRDCLEHDHGICLSVSTVRRIRLQAGQAAVRRRRAPKHRSRRERKPRAGMMLQIDASPHQWFGADHPPCALVAAIDDATSEVFALFRDQEDTVGYMLLLQQVISQRGLPETLYCDRHTIFLPPSKQEPTIQEQLQGQGPKTQFSRAMNQLGIRIISAGSPQAKGRVERLFGSLQDRLCAELAIHGISTIEQANAFLPAFVARYNTQFADRKSVV